jgi:urease accessory protein
MAIDRSSLLLLLNWMSPTFPIGSFAYSHGLEQAIADRRIGTAEQVEHWIIELLQNGSGWNDAVLFANCWSGEVEDLNELALALAGSAERYMEATCLGRNFNTAATVWTGRSMTDHSMTYPVAAGCACKAMEIPRADALLAFLQGFCAAQVSVAVRLVPLGQTSGLAIMRNLAPVVAETARRAQSASLDDLGGCCLSAEIAAMAHETLEPRIFRT